MPHSAPKQLDLSLTPEPSGVSAEQLPIEVPTRPRIARTFAAFRKLGELLRLQLQQEARRRR